MASHQDVPRLTATKPRTRVSLSGLVAQVLAFAAGAVLLIGAFVFSLLLVAVLVSLGLLAWGYVWWRTRALRKLVREHLRSADATRPPDGGSVIEGDFVREAERARR
jgi:hypothetical protein